MKPADAVFMRFTKNDGYIPTRMTRTTRIIIASCIKRGTSSFFFTPSIAGFFDGPRKTNDVNLREYPNENTVATSINAVGMMKNVTPLWITWKAPIKIKNSLMKQANGGAPARLNAAIVEDVPVTGILPASPPMSLIFRIDTACITPPAARKKSPLLIA